MRLNKDIFEELILELSRTPKATEEEFKKRSTAVHEFVKVKNKTSKILATSKLIHYSLSNENLNKIISNITKRKTSDILSLHTIESSLNSETKSHIDNHSELTLNILLKDEFKGGNFYLNGKLYEELRKKGDHILYNGSRDKHSVSKITKGVRKSLVVWYKHTKNRSII
jgi:hypothetical protein